MSSSGQNTAPSAWVELRGNWKPLTAATLGLSSGLSLNAFVVSVFSPYVLADFQWSKAQLALVGMLSLLTLIGIPLAGRATDLFGVRRVAVVGIVCYPLSALSLALMGGDIRVYYAILALQLLVCATTTVTVYSRIVAERFVENRGLALALFACGPPLVSAIASPLLVLLIEAQGWRVGYYGLAIYSAATGLLAFRLLPVDQAPVKGWKSDRSTRRDYTEILQNPAFWIVLVSTVLCSLPFTLLHSQLTLMVQEHQVSSTQAGFMVSVFAVGVIIGRFISGLALDRFPTHLVAAIGMGLPCIGLFILAVPQMALPLVVIAVGLMGLSFGSEADILSYTAARYFPMEVYSSVLGLVMVAVGVAMTAGSALLSVTLARTDSFSVFNAVAGVSVLVGGLNLLRLRKVQALEHSLPGAAVSR